MNCPQCGKPLEAIKAPYWMNSDQWDATKAGDYFCETCPDNWRGASRVCYWFKSEVEAAEATKADAMMHV